MNLLNREFCKVVCINLLERKDKRDKIAKKFHNLDINFEWYNAVKYGFVPKIVEPINKSKVGKFNSNQPFEVGAALSHYSVIKEALLTGVERLFVFEDDIMFHKDFNNKLELYWNKLPKDWDMIMLYSFMYDILPENKRVSSRWLKSYKSWSLMAYGMTKEIMKEYIKSQDNFFTISDAVTYRIQENNKFNIYSAIPALCIPEANSSDIRDVANYTNKPTIINMGYNNDNYE